MEMMLRAHLLKKLSEKAVGVIYTGEYSFANPRTKCLWIKTRAESSLRSGVFQITTFLELFG